MMWLALGIALAPVAVLFWIGRLACGGARLMYIGDVPERLRTLVQIPEEQQRPDALRTPGRGHDLPQAGAQVGGRGGQSIHSCSIIQPEQRNHG